MITDRQTEVLTLLATGMTYKEVAACLYISPSTVKRHLHGAYTSLDVQTATTTHSMIEAFRVLGWLKAPAQ